MADLEQTVSEGSENQEAPQISATEQAARDQGWVPKEDFNGDEHRWVDAGEFLRRGELFGKIESQNKELKAIRETLAQFKDHHSKVQETAYKKALADLKAKKAEALIEGDAQLVVEVDDQLAEIREQQRVIKQQPVHQEAPQEHPVFVAWKQKNSWYENNRPMRGWADNRGVELASEGKSPDEVLRIVEQEIRKEFPNRFENPNRTKPSTVENGVQKGRSEGAFELTPEQTQAMKKFVKMGLMTEKEYIDDLKAVSK